MIEFRQISKQYDTKLAVDQLNLTLNDGEIIGLIGHNGAGKSTTIKMLVSILEPTSGEIFVDGLSLKEHRNDIKKKIGYVADTPDLFLRLSPDEYWNLVASAYGIPKTTLNDRINELTTLFSLEGQRYLAIESFSHGMRQKVFLIGALLSNPDIWVLDEPMTGLDPQAAFDLKHLMRQHADQGHTVLFSTHVLEVAEQICDRLAIMKKGQLIFYGTIDTLKAQHPDKSLETIYLELAGRQEAGGEVHEAQ